MARGRHAEAVLLWQGLARTRPDDADAVVGLGYALIESGRPAEAIQAAEAATHRLPREGRLPHLIGHALQRLGMPGPAIGAFHVALELAPRDSTIHASLASALLAEGDIDEAARHGREAFGIAPTAAHAATLSCILIEQGRLADALAVADHGVAAGRAGHEVLVNRSIALHGLGRPTEAVAAARRAMAVSGTPVTTHHLAALLLAHGHLTPEAWGLYEARLKLPGTRPGLAPDRRWRGEPVQGRVVLLHAEQGLGDTLQFVRYVPMVVARGATVVLVVQPSLRRLLSATPGASLVLAMGEELPAFDLVAPLMSLPGLFGTTLDTVPAPLPAPGPTQARAPGPLRVGIAWAGSAGFVEDRKRSMPPERLWRLAQPGRVALFSLQYPSVPLPPGITDLMAGVTDMQDTAERLAGLDLVVTVDTAIAHLAGSLGKPVWLLSRFRGCWRWLEGRADTPWYPSMTLYRQHRPNDWDDVMRRVAGDLEAVIDPVGR